MDGQIAPSSDAFQIAKLVYACASRHAAAHFVRIISGIVVTANELESHLEALILDVGDLARIEDGLSDFNFFEAIGAIRSELRHSDFLAFLLDPSANHGLADTFLRRFLQRAVIDGRSENTAVTPLQLGVWDLEGCIVERESDYVDILITSDQNSFAILIENKIDSTEHSDQLRRYEEAVRKRYPGYALLTLYLTLDGDKPSQPGYVAISYGTVCEIIEDVLSNRGAALYADVAMLLRHYAKIIRNHFMNESELADLAVRFYLRHRKALDYIFEKRPDKRVFISRVLKGYVENNPALMLDDSTDRVVRFVHRDWPDSIFARGDDRWLDSNRVLMFEFDNRGSSVKLSLLIGPGDVDLRQRLFEHAAGAQPPFKCSGSQLNAKWNTIWTRSFANNLELLEAAAIEARLSIAWSQFLTSELPALHEKIQEFVDRERHRDEAV